MVCWVTTASDWIHEQMEYDPQKKHLIQIFCSVTWSSHIQNRTRAVNPPIVPRNIFESKIMVSNFLPLCPEKGYFEQGPG